MKWNGNLYIDCTLHFGQRSVHEIFNAIDDALE